VSITRRIIDTARSGINSVMERIVVDDTPLSHVDEAELHRELEQRTAARTARPQSPTDNPLARMAGASDEARAERKAMAAKRATRVQAARAKRERAAEAAQEEFFRRAREQERQQASQGSSQTAGSQAGQRSTRSAGSAGASSSARGSTGSRSSPFQRQNDKIAEYYKVLDLPYGTDFAQVKASYRKLMRKYHPDRHTGNPKKLKAATELSMRVTQAYTALEEHLKDKK
jgi:DnaJ-domain-containing protein 1